MPSPAARRRRTAFGVSPVLLGKMGLLGNVGLGLLVLVALMLGPVRAGAVEPSPPGSGPTLTLPSDVAFVLGRAGDAYQIEADGDPVPEIRVDGLPAGLRLTSYGDGSATIDGTPTGPTGPTTVTVTARNAGGRSIGLVTVTVEQAPAFAGWAPLRFEVGVFASLFLRVAGYPAPSIEIEGDLPTGLAFTDNGDGTATIAGTPLTAGDVPVTLTAVNVVADTAVTTTVSVTSPDRHRRPPRPVKVPSF